MTQDGSSFQYVSDPRVKFDFPRIVKLAGGADPSAANAYLQARQWQMLTDALSCEAQQYAAFDWNDMMPNFAGTYGSYPDEQVGVLSVSPTLISYDEGGSLDCGGPHPYNHHEFTTLDVKLGEPVHFERILKDWIPSDFDGNPVAPDYAKAHPEDVQWGPGDTLFALVKAHLKDAPDAALDDSDCDYDNLIRHNLAVAMKPGNRLLFTLDGLEYAIQACATDIFEAPVTELKDFLAPTAVEYFPVLKH
jgi:hypothetical protein